MSIEHLLNRAKLRFRQQGILGVTGAAIRLTARRTGFFPHLVRCRQIFDARRYNYITKPSPFNTFFVDPTDISHYLFPEYKDKYRWFGRVQPGKWDIEAQKLEETKKFQGVVQRYEKECDWKETVVFDHMLELIAEGKYPDSCRSLEDIKKRYAKIDELYHNIKNNGYKQGEDITSPQGDIVDICIAIGRNGEILLQGDGIHRVAIARVLDVSKIPTKVSMRHLQWQRTRDAIASGEREPDDLVDHPDLQDLVHSTNSR